MILTTLDSESIGMYKNYLCVIVVLSVLFLTMPAVSAETSVSRYLDEFADTLVVKQGWGNLGINTAAWSPAAAPSRLRMGEQEYDRGLGHHAPGEIIIPLEGRYLSFSAEVGVQWQGGGKGSVIFEAWVDGEKRFDSGLMSDTDPAKSLQLDVVGARELRLAALDGGDGISCDMANWANACLAHDGRIPAVGQARYSLGGEGVMMEGSYTLIGYDGGTQLAFSRPLGFCTFISAAGQSPHIDIPISPVTGPFTVHAEVTHAGGVPAEVSLVLYPGEAPSRTDLSSGHGALSVSGNAYDGESTVRLSVSGQGGDTAVRLTRLYLTAADQKVDLDFFPAPANTSAPPMPREVVPHPLLTAELIEWDWRMQDGIGAGTTRNTFKAAAEKTLERGNTLAAGVIEQPGALTDTLAKWNSLQPAFDALRASNESGDGEAWEVLWRETHRLRRDLMFVQPLADTGPLLFVKQAPGMFSHQLTQYYGRYARPGGGVYVLERPGKDMEVRRLADTMPQGSYMHPEVSYDGTRIVVAFCETGAAPEDTFHGTKGHYYHLYEITGDGTEWRQLTDGAFDDFAPKELPNGQYIFISTRRGGMHRCGTPGCEVYTLTLMNQDGSEVQTVSYHETQEWDPAVLNDGRVVYTRWDYVDRDAVHYQQLWVTRPDGTAPAAFYGNNTLNPVGVWEARAIPGSCRIMATAAPHHGMTAGSIILVDPTVAIDGLEPLTRLTPEVPFPESESPLPPHWRSTPGPEPPNRSPEMDRWPGQCYRSPWPLSEQMFLAAYSYDPLIGEPKNNLANMFGLYLVDAHGNRELLYRDLNIASLWPVPLRPRDAAPVLPSPLEANAPKEGTYYVQNVYESDPALPSDTPVTHLRIVQVLPKSTSGANNPTVGAANASPGKQVLGTVPVEPDGSAYFAAPAGKALSFQALDASGQAVQVMRSVSYLQPGEKASCIGCHENRMDAPPPAAAKTQALRRPPSAITPAPDGSLPLSYPILVQPVLDKHCVQCHGDARADGPEGTPIRLTGKPEGRYTESYNALVSRVSYAAWGRGGVFPEGNCEPLAQPGFFGATGSALTKLLEAGHYDVTLEDEDWERLITWMDANALFYGTFNFADQERQQRGERISGPGLE